MCQRTEHISNTLYFQHAVSQQDPDEQSPSQISNMLPEKAEVNTSQVLITIYFIVNILVMQIYKTEFTDQHKKKNPMLFLS